MANGIIKSCLRNAETIHKRICYFYLITYGSYGEQIPVQSKYALGSYTSIQVNVDAVGQNITGDAANETSIAVNPINPDNIVIGWRQFNSVDSSFREAGWAYSQDGGLHWQFPGSLIADEFRTDPVLDVDSDGNFYYQSIFIEFNDDGRPKGSRALHVFKSTDSGVGWLDPITVLSEPIDKGWMAVDRTGGESDGFIYTSWRAGSSLDHFSRSIDHSASFEQAVRIPKDPTFGSLTVGPNGEVFVVGRNDVSTFKDGRLISDPFLLATSLDAQNPETVPTFTVQELDLGGTSALFFGFDTPNPFGLTGQVNISTDHSEGKMRGNIYVLASVDPPGIDRVDVHLIRSSDGGKTWSEPVRVNDDSAYKDSWQWFATHDVAPNSRIDAVWFDTRNSLQGKISELFYSYSWGGGQIWSANQPVTPPFNSYLPSRVVNGEEQQINKLGDYIDLMSDESGVNVAYAATFNGEHDAYFVRLFPDCNDNTLSDVEDINQGASQDFDGNHIPDECEIVPVRGDLDGDGDGDVDRNDITLLLNYRNQVVITIDDPKDLNGDGAISARDAWALRQLCSRQRCAVQ